MLAHVYENEFDRGYDYGCGCGCGSCCDCDYDGEWVTMSMAAAIAEGRNRLFRHLIHLPDLVSQN